TGLGTLVVTKDKAKELIETMIEQGDMTRKEGKELLNKFLNKTEKETSKLSNIISEELASRLEKAGFVSREKYEALEERVRKLEDEIKNNSVEPEINIDEED
ncbi:MAG: phasin family protein, partial [bacterium]